MSRKPRDVGTRLKALSNRFMGYDVESENSGQRSEVRVEFSVPNGDFAGVRECFNHGGHRDHGEPGENALRRRERCEGNRGPSTPQRDSRSESCSFAQDDKG